MEAYDSTIAERADLFATELMENYKKQVVNVYKHNWGLMHSVIDYGSPKIKIPREIAKKHGKRI